MEPLIPTWKGTDLEGLALELLMASATLAGGPAPDTTRALGRLVRSMNSYYSNLIEGHRTHPADLDRVLTQTSGDTPEKRDLLLLAKAHIEVDEALSERVRTSTLINPASLDFLCKTHREFYDLLPPSLRVVSSRAGESLDVIPGKLRDVDVHVGRHVPPSPDSLQLLMTRFAEGFDPGKHSGVQQILVALASHHRLTWIHPFVDGNGRVARLFTQCMLIRAGVDGRGLWSISRGLARKRGEYTSHLAAADAGRRNDYDGRGNLSAEAFLEFTRFMLEVAIDQATFMRQLFSFENVLTRIEDFVKLMTQRGLLKQEAVHVLQAAYLRGALPRSEANRLTGLEERMARSVTSQLTKFGLLISESHRAPLRINFPSSVAPYFFPDLYPADVEAEIVAVS